MSNQDILAAPCVVQKTKMAYLKVQNSPQTNGGHHGGFSLAFIINATVYFEVGLQLLYTKYNIHLLNNSFSNIS